MALKNKSKNKKLATNIKVCRSIHSKARGLMFTLKSAVYDRALVFEFNSLAKRDLHMFCVFYPIDVLFLDSDGLVVEIKERFKPFTIYSPKHKSQYIVELAEGVLRETNTAIGDKIAW